MPEISPNLPLDKIPTRASVIKASKYKEIIERATSLPENQAFCLRYEDKKVADKVASSLRPRVMKANCGLKQRGGDLWVYKPLDRKPKKT